MPSRSAQKRKSSATRGVAPAVDLRLSPETGSEPRRILVIDVGGSHVKFRVGKDGPIEKFESGPELTAAGMVKRLRKLLGDADYDAVSIGYPGVVIRGRIAAEPFNLGHGWVGFDFHTALKKPVRVINDAAMQAVGSYLGGRMLFLGLGTGLGAALILDGVLEPMEIGHLRYKHDRTFEDYVGERGRHRMGTKKWRKVVADVVTHLRQALEVEYVVLGGGNACRLKELPEGARLGDNRNAFVGGLRIWRPTGLAPDVSDAGSEPGAREARGAEAERGSDRRKRVAAPLQA